MAMLQTRDPSVSGPFAASVNPSSSHHVSKDSKISISFGACNTSTIIMHLYDAPIREPGAKRRKTGVRPSISVSGVDKF